ncbi:protein-disulfide reductase DsbD [uncultured Herbaspirillum sp.]|uniref:protein-disulfide reductase DsbD n=1 Tax=uncultured Herbaspirillum sp. TaxID=160236 RepID=UPI0026222341|nr:protein-disulfide reductase DsbD [uncultured Herbaspirillum sp.]
MLSLFNRLLWSWRCPVFAFLALLPVTCWSLALQPSAVIGDAQFLGAEQAFHFRLDQVGDGKLQLRGQIADGYYLYRDRIEAVSLDDGKSVALDKPEGERKDDPNFGVVRIYRHEVLLTLIAPVNGDIELTWQGCADAGLCYAPHSQRIQLPAAADGGNAQAHTFDSQSLAQAAWSGGSDIQISDFLQRSSLLVLLPLFLLMGMGMAFSPCVLPMVPIISSIVVGANASRRRSLMLSLAFVLPMALVYAAMGVAAAYLGRGLQALLQRPEVMLAFALVFALLALAMFGFYSLQLPASLRTRLERHSPRGGSLTGSASMGVLSALLVGPCMTAPLAGVLLFISQTGKMLDGGLLLLSLGLGMGVPLMIVGTLSRQLLPRPGAWMEWIKNAFGFGLLAMAVWTAQRGLPPAVGLALWVFWLANLTVALYVGAQGLPARLRIPVHAVAAVLGCWGVLATIGLAAGQPDAFHPLKEILSARRAVAPAQAGPTLAVSTLSALRQQLTVTAGRGQATIVDFSADWCTACQTLEHQVLTDASVIDALRGIQRIEVDVTTTGTAQQELMQAYGVIGPPTFLFFDASGKEQRDLRLVGEFNAAQLGRRLQRLAQHGLSADYQELP